MKKRALLAALSLVLLFTPVGSKAQNIEQNKTEQKIIQQTKEISEYIDKNKQEPYDFILDAFSSHQIVLLGEKHDAKEHRVFAAELIKRLEGKIDCVALEIRSEFQVKINEFLKSDNPKWVFRIYGQPYTGILLSQEYIKILESIKSSKLDAICIDNDEQGIEQRDFVMAKNIGDYLKKNKDAKILVYAGNLHVRKTQRGLMTSIYVPLVNSGISREKIFSVSQESDSLFDSLEKTAEKQEKAVAVNVDGPIENLTYGAYLLQSTYEETFDAVILHPK